MTEEKKTEKKGFFKKLFGGGKQEPCCCGVQIEEIPEEKEQKNPETSDEKPR